MLQALGLHFHMDGVGAGCGDINILNVALLPHIQPNFPVQSAVGQIVDDEAEGRDLPVFGAVELHRDAVVLSRTDESGDLDAEGGVAAAVGGGENAVDVDGGDMRRAVF